jgi:hypothetical protein
MTTTSTGFKTANPDELRKRRARLRKNEEVFRYLRAEGVSAEAMEHFNMGLPEPYSGTENALVFPMIGPSGMSESRYAYMNVPGVTVAPKEQELRFWMAGEIKSYFSEGMEGRNSVFVVSDPSEVWAVWMALQRTPLSSEVLVLSSSNPIIPPSEWMDRTFWKQWGNVYLGLNNDALGARLASELSKVVEQEVYRLAPPRPNPRCDGSWSSFFRSEGLAQFERLFAIAPKTETKVSAVLAPDEIGRLAYNPVNIDGAFHDGYLHYTVQTMVCGREVTKGSDGQPTFKPTQHQETIVVRSDRSFHKAEEMDAPRGTPKCDRIFRLGNTPITRKPRRNRFATWRWESIVAYKEGRSEIRDLKWILNDVHESLVGAVYLPKLDHWLLTLVVAVTYVQEIFDAVPLILAVGEGGSGKSTLGRAMASLCANGCVIGSGSPAAIARTIDEVRGFTVLDDLEKVAERKGTDRAQFTELVQNLKVSYSKTTATKTIMDASTMTPETLNLYGVKLINNTGGVDAILGSRMLKIETGKIPAEFRKLMEGIRPAGFSESRVALRDELHTWAFLHADSIAQIYRRSKTATMDRFDEITLPLRVIEAFLDGAPSAAPSIAPSACFNAVLVKQSMEPIDTENEEALLRAAVEPAIVRGQIEISSTYVLLRMRELAHAGRQAGQNPDVSNLSRTRVGRMMRRFGMIDKKAKETRVRLHGHSLRVYPLNRDYVTRVLGMAGYLERRPLASPVGFCGVCEDCTLTTHDCPIKARRLSRGKRQANGAATMPEHQGELRSVRL